MADAWLPKLQSVNKSRRFDANDDWDNQYLADWPNALKIANPGKTLFLYWEESVEIVMHIAHVDAVIYLNICAQNNDQPS